MDNRNGIGKIGTAFVLRRARKLSGQEVLRAADRTEVLRRKFTKSGPLKRFREDLTLLLALLRDYRGRRYRRIPFWAIGAVAFTLFYVINPIDFMPDFIPFFGLVDDAAVAGICLSMLERELHRYREWKLGGGERTDV